MVIKKFKGGSLSETLLIEKRTGDRVIRKTVSLTENREYGFQRWYSQLKRLQRYSVIFPGLFPTLLDYGVDGNIAYMDIAYFEDAVNAQDYIEACQVSCDVEDFFLALTDSMMRMHSTSIPSSPPPIGLYIREEVEQRLNDCGHNEEFMSFIKNKKIRFNGKEVTSFIHNLDGFKQMCNTHYVCTSETFTHGNITLENILYVPHKKQIIFIDPYEENIIDSRLAEFSQLMQSSNSKYEMYNRETPKIDECSVECVIPPSFGMDYFNALLIKYLKVNFTEDDFTMIRLLEISQFIRMLPFKMVINKNAAFFFYGLASYLFEEMKESAYL